MHHGFAMKKGTQRFVCDSSRFRTRYNVPGMRCLFYEHTEQRERESDDEFVNTILVSHPPISLFFYLAAARPEVRSGSLLPDVALFYSFLLVGDTRIACLRATRPTSKLWRVSQNFNIALVKIAVVFYRNRCLCVYVCVHTLAVALGRTRVLAMPLPIARSIRAMLSDRRDVFQYFHRVLREILVFAVTISRVRRVHSWKEKESLANSEGPRASIKRPDSRKFVFAPLPLPSSSFRAAARSVIRSLPLSPWLRRTPPCLALRLNVHRLCTRTDFVEGKNRKAM